MSESERPELLAVSELATLVGHLSDELAGFRRRALVAETRLRELEEGTDAEGASRRVAGRMKSLEEENAMLRSRLDGATARTKQVLDRIHFLRQQAEAGGAGLVGGSDR